MRRIGNPKPFFAQNGAWCAERHAHRAFPLLRGFRFSA